jgi:SPP1 gp7 family putative phage head morphogenesis protein
MGIRDNISKIFRLPQQKSAAVPFRLGYGGVSFENPNPQGVSEEELLRAYSNDPWLYAAGSRISQSVADTKWHLFEIDKDGERSEVTDEEDELKHLLNYPNEAQSGNDLMELGEVFLLLIGKDYWRLSKEKTGWELNIIPSAWTKPILDKTGLVITNYRYERNGIRKDFPAEEIIPFVHPNPISLLDGISPTHPIAIELAEHNYARLFQKYWFLNEAESGVILKTEAADQTEVDRMVSAYEARHRGYGRSHKVDIFSGVTEIIQGESKQKDMQYPALMEWLRKVELGSFGLPYTILGGTDMVQRGNAEAAQYTYAKWVLHPRLEFRKRVLNKYLVPKFLGKAGVRRELDYEDPTPEDRAALVQEAVQGWNGQLFTRNQALKILKYDPLEGDEGEEYKQASTNPFESFGNAQDTKEGQDREKGYSDPKVKSLFDTEAKAEEYWKRWVKQAESFEPKFIESMQRVFDDTQKEVLANLSTATTRDTKLFDIGKFKENYVKSLNPVMSEIMASAIKNGRELIEPTNPHKAGIFDLLNQFALNWLKNRLIWAALEVGNETEELLRQTLIDGFSQGLGIPKIAQNIRQIPGFADRARSQRIARTEILSAHSQGTLEGYKQSGRVKQVKFYTAMDERTCEYCNNYHNQVYNLGDEMPIPLHPNCRCVYLPVVEI